MLLKASNINLIYDIDTTSQCIALKDINLCIEKGEFVGLMGPSGCGKSSLIYMLSGLKVPTYGSIFYNDIDISSYSDMQSANLRRSDFGFIFQRHFLLNYLSVYENVLLASTEKNPTIRREKTLELLEKFDLVKIKDKEITKLSVGQRQKTAIARAMVNSPKIIFADEPTASIDHAAAYEIMNTLAKERNDTTLIVATHDETILKDADRVIRMWDGHLINQ